MDQHLLHSQVRLLPWAPTDNGISLLITPQPIPYLRDLPDNTFVSSEGCQYQIWGGDFAYYYINVAAGLLMNGFIVR